MQKISQREVDRPRMAERNAEICRRVNIAREKVSVVAADYGMTVERVYQIIGNRVKPKAERV